MRRWVWVVLLVGCHPAYAPLPPGEDWEANDRRIRAELERSEARKAAADEQRRAAAKEREERAQAARECILAQVDAVELEPVAHSPLYARWLSSEWPTERERRAAFRECLLEGFEHRECLDPVVAPKFEAAAERNRRRQLDRLEQEDQARARCVVASR